MNIDKESTIGEIARNVPVAVRFFEKVGIDYCCGGGRTLEQACQAANLDFRTVLSTLETLRESAMLEEEENDWSTEPLADLITYIVDKHHSVVQSEVPRLVELIAKMCQAHSEQRPELLQVRDLIYSLQKELFSHLRKEEEILFPYVKQLEHSLHQNGPKPSSCFGVVTNPINVMEHEHENAGQILAQIQSLLANREGCPTCLEFFKTFDEFEKDLHQHIHLENNILFPRAIELDAAKTV